MRRAIFAVVAAVILVAVGSGAYTQAQLSQPIPLLVPAASFPSTITVEGQPPAIPWPTVGAAAVAVPSLGVVGSFSDQSPRPIASIGKVMTAHVILANHPLAPREPGPSVTVTAEDVRNYLADLADGQSTFPVVVGQRLTQYEMLQALMLPSGNNIADILAKWDSGSREAFVVKMNAKAAELGMKSTRFADASGYSPQTASTAQDLILLGQAAMKEPVFVEIVAQQEATLPVTGRVFNVNTALGRDGNIGIKTGSTPEAGSCFMFAIRRDVGGQPMTFIGAVLDQNFLTDAFERSALIAAAAASGVRTHRVLNQSQVIGSYTAQWGGHADIVPTEDVDFLVWPGMAVQAEVNVEPINAPTPRGTKVGTLSLDLGDQTKVVDLVTTASIEAPSRDWRLMRPLREAGLVR